MLLTIQTIFLCTMQLSAQVFGGMPTSTQWQQRNYATNRIIFPKGLDSIASEVEALVQSTNVYHQWSLGKRMRKINIVLQNRTVLANGYVGMGPFRSEFYLTPSSDNFELGTMSWTKQLALHEYRHVQQNNNFENGASAIIRKLLGEEGYSLAINTAIPDWFFEGDAVFIETALSSQGRGRLPFFLKAYPSLWASGKKYSWMKLRNGSFKDYTPNHYDLGFLLVNYGYLKYGNDFWRKITHEASAYKGWFYPFQKAIKKHSGISYRSFRNQALEFYEQKFKEHGLLKDSALDFLSLSPVNKRKLTNSVYPVQISENELLYLKYGVNRRPAFYVKDSTGDHLIRHRDISIDDQFSYRNGRIVYAAFETHPRWGMLNYSVLKVLDINTQKQRTLKHKTRYFSPDISEDGGMIVANHVSTDGSSGLIVLDGKNGQTIKEIKRKEISYFANPKIVDQHTVIAVLRRHDATTAIAKIDLITDSIQNLTPFSSSIVGQLEVNKDIVYFTASQDVKDEIFKFDIKSQSLYTFKTPGVGSYFPSNNFGKQTWSTFTADGYQLQQVSDDTTLWKQISIDFFTKSKVDLLAEIKPATRDSMINPTAGKVLKYPSLFRPFNFHSWRPNYSDPEYSFTLYGNNILNTVSTEVYYLYNQNSRTHSTGASITYAGLFPQISMGTEYTYNRKTLVSNKIKQWNEWNNHIGLSLPLHWTSHKTHKSLSVYSNLYQRIDFNTGANKDKFRQLRYNYLSHSVSWYQRVQTMGQQIYPRLGYSASLRFRHALNMYESWQGSASVLLYLPGIGSTHGLVLSGSVLTSGQRDRIFANNIAFARGYHALDSGKLFTTGFNYHLPLFYPDWGFANIFYLQRVRANLFWDNTGVEIKKDRPWKNYQSVGAEVYFDTKWWSQHPVSLGFRLGKLATSSAINNRKLFFEILLPVSLIPN